MSRGGDRERVRERRDGESKGMNGGIVWCVCECVYVCVMGREACFVCLKTNCEQSVSCERLMLHQDVARLLNKEIRLNYCVIVREPLM